MALHKHIQGQKHHMAESNKHVYGIQTSMAWRSTQAYSYYLSKQTYIQTNACSYKCMTYLTYLIASQHLCINACSCCMHVPGIHTIQNPNKQLKGQNKIKQDKTEQIDIYRCEN